MTTTIVIPCYNEANRLDVQAFRDYSATAPHVIFRFVDDGSQDETLAVLEHLAEQMPGRVVVQRMACNVGKAEAVRAGLQAALFDGSEFVGFWDADLATPLQAISQFERVLQRDQELEAVIGSRMPLMGRSIQRTIIRSWCGRLFATAASWVLGSRIFDSQCGAKLFRVNGRFRTWVARPFVSRWIFDVEILARLQWLYRRDYYRELESMYPSKSVARPGTTDSASPALEFDGPSGTYRVRTSVADEGRQAGRASTEQSQSGLVEAEWEEDDLPGPLVLPPVQTVRRTVYEYPLDEWRDVAGSKLKARDFVRAISELGSIYFGYRWLLMGDWTRQLESPTVDLSDAPAWLHDEAIESDEWRHKSRRAA